jgi:hypothetical protein
MTEWNNIRDASGRVAARTAVDNSARCQVFGLVPALVCPCGGFIHIDLDVDEVEYWHCQICKKTYYDTDADELIEK